MLDYADCLVDFELFLEDIRNLDILSNEDLDFVKAKTKEEALPSYRTYNDNMPHVSEIKDLIDQKSDKSNSVEIVDRQDYIKKMSILSDQKKIYHSK